MHRGARGAGAVRADSEADWEMKLGLGIGWRLIAVVSFMLLGSVALAVERMKISTGPEQSAQAQAGRELAKTVARAAGIDLVVVPATGPAESLLRLRDETGPQMALLSADTAHAYLMAAASNPDAQQLLAPVRVIAPLHREVLYFIVRGDASFESIQEIRDARINVGPPRSGSALSISTFYQSLFDAPIRDDKLSFLSHEEALAKLITDHSVDVVALVADQSTRLLFGMKPEARRFIKLLKFEMADPRNAAVFKLYEPATVRAANYPNLLTEDLPAVAVRIYWVGYGYRRTTDDGKMSRMVRAWCQSLPRLKSEGNALWAEVDLGLPELRPGWHWARPAQRELSRCIGAEPPTDTCTQSERLLGLCD